MEHNNNNSTNGGGISRSPSSSVFSIGGLQIPLTIPGTNISYMDFFSRSSSSSGGGAGDANSRSTSSTLERGSSSMDSVSASAETPEVAQSPNRPTTAQVEAFQRHQRSKSEGRSVITGSSPGSGSSSARGAVPSSPTSAASPRVLSPVPPAAAASGNSSLFASFLLGNFLTVTNSALTNLIESPANIVKEVIGTGDKNMPSSTITRPSNLRQKSPEEEAKHRKQYEEMMLQYKEKLEREANEQRRKEELKERRERRMLKTVEEWKKSDIISNWEAKKNDKRTKELLWMGVPPNIRGLVWPLACTNNLQITRDLYEICAKQGKAARQRKRLSKGASSGPSSSSSTEDELGRVNSVTLIELDLPRTFPALTIFNKDGPCHPQLLEILEAYAIYRPDIGYVQGMSFIAAVLLLYLEPFPAFVCLANLLNRPLFVSFYRMEGDKIQKYVEVLEDLMQEKLPKIHAQFREMGISPLVFIVDWFLTIFSKALPLEAVSRVWDNYFVEGDPFLWRTVLGLLSFHSETILSYSYDHCLQFLTHLPQSFDLDALFESIASIKLTQAQLTELLKARGLSP